MRIVVGGQHRKIGKTSAVCGVIRSFPEMRWTAVKVTGHTHGLFAEGMAGIQEEFEAGGATDTARYLAAGAERSLLCYVPAGAEESALTYFGGEMERSANLIVESTSMARALRPDLFLMLLSPAQDDFKSSAREGLEGADALLLTAPLKEMPWLKGAAQPRFRYVPGEPFSPDLLHWLEKKMA